MIIYTNMDQIKYFKSTSSYCCRFPNSVRSLDFKVAHVVTPRTFPATVPPSDLITGQGRKERVRTNDRIDGSNRKLARIVVVKSSQVGESREREGGTPQPACCCINQRYVRFGSRSRETCSVQTWYKIRSRFRDSIYSVHLIVCNYYCRVSVAGDFVVSGLI